MPTEPQNKEFYLEGDFVIASPKAHTPVNTPSSSFCGHKYDQSTQPIFRKTEIAVVVSVSSFATGDLVLRATLYTWDTRRLQVGDSSP